MTAHATSLDDLLTTNPYDGHPSLSQLDADVLWEYAKLAHHVKAVRLYRLVSQMKHISNQI